MGFLVANVGALLIVLSGLSLMLGFRPAASWLFRAALVLMLVTAILRYLACCLSTSARSASLTGGGVLAALGIGGLALYGWFTWRRLHGAHGAGSAPHPQSRERALPPPPRPEDAP
jgi:hypothetical protein